MTDPCVSLFTDENVEKLRKIMCATVKLSHMLPAADVTTSVI